MLISWIVSASLHFLRGNNPSFFEGNSTSDGENSMVSKSWKTNANSHTIHFDFKGVICILFRWDKVK